MAAVVERARMPAMIDFFMVSLLLEMFDGIAIVYRQGDPGG
jgi:hypothetical protein